MIHRELEGLDARATRRFSASRDLGDKTFKGAGARIGVCTSSNPLFLRTRWGSSKSHYTGVKFAPCYFSRGAQSIWVARNQQTFISHGSGAGASTAEDDSVSGRSGVWRGQLPTTDSGLLTVSQWQRGLPYKGTHPTHEGCTPLTQSPLRGPAFWPHHFRG